VNTPFDRPSRGRVPLDQDALDELATGSDKVAARPIRINREHVDDLTRRIVDAMKREGECRGQEPVGVRESILDDVFTGITVDGEPKTVMVVVTSGRGSADPFVSGGGFGWVTGGPYKGAPIIIVQIDGRELWRTFGQYEVVGKYLNNLLMHEITHAMDRIRRDEPAVSRGGYIPTTDDIDLGAYYNDPHEVRAYMREIYEEIRPIVLGSMGKGSLREKWGLGGAVGRFLRVNHIWKRVSPHLTRENRNRILKGIVTAFEDDLPDVPLAPARVASAWLTRTAWAGGACNPMAMSTAWISPEGNVIPVPPGETHSSWAREYLADDPGFLDQGYGAARYLTDTRGWVRQVNAYTLETGPAGASDLAMRAAVDLVVDCVVRRKDFDPEEDTMTLGVGSRTLRPTIADFVEQYGTRQQFDSMYDRLMSRTAKSRPKYQGKKEVPKADGTGTMTVYQYGPRQVANRHREKADRIEGLRGRIADLRRRVKSDLKSDDPGTRLTALAVALIDATYERVGNDDSANNGHYGVTGWTMDHVTFSKDGKRATFQYVGKSGVEHEKTVDDPALVKALKSCCGDKGKDDPVLSDGDVRVTSRMVNDYLRGFDVTAKDLRGYHANREMQERLRAIRRDGPELPRPRKERDAILKAEFEEALEGAAEAVGHEPATLRRQYLVPWLEDAFMKDGTVIDRLDKKASALVGWTFVATKTQAEREDAEAERLVRRTPKLKPSRDDSKRERVRVDDPDIDAGRDKDMSLNYKNNG
jgi:DNA topoisomerase-1